MPNQEIHEEIEENAHAGDNRRKQLAINAIAFALLDLHDAIASGVIAAQDIDEIFHLITFETQDSFSSGIRKMLHNFAKKNEA